MESIHFFAEDIEFTIHDPLVTSDWLLQIIQDHQEEVENINFIFCSDDYLLEVNRTYLDHDYYTDIITFDNREIEEQGLESDIFISVDRVRDNALSLGSSFDHELYRVIIHGVLHLLGWDDKTDDQKQAMREKEEACLSLHLNYK